MLLKIPFDMGLDPNSAKFPDTKTKMETATPLIDLSSLYSVFVILVLVFIFEFVVYLFIHIFIIYIKFLKLLFN